MTARRLLRMGYSDLWKLDTPEALVALDAKQHAFHEAGHAWAAHQYGIPLTKASIAQVGKPYVGACDCKTAELAAFGYLAQAVSVAVDLRDGVSDTHDVDGCLTQDVYEHLVCMIDADCCCRRGGDPSAEERLADRAWVQDHIGLLLHDWHGIDALARLLTRSSVNPNRSRALLTS